ncbi:MAG: hypothetical protein NZ952_00385 [Candidatus Bathyarchaeota archaeon]|nr:hypothetical protein [Candidatus Bathyarchaeota archaeon]
MIYKHFSPEMRSGPPPMTKIPFFEGAIINVLHPIFIELKKGGLLEKRINFLFIMIKNIIWG